MATDIVFPENSLWEIIFSSDADTTGDTLELRLWDKSNDSVALTATASGGASNTDITFSVDTASLASETVYEVEIVADPTGAEQGLYPVESKHDTLRQIDFHSVT